VNEDAESFLTWPLIRQNDTKHTPFGEQDRQTNEIDEFHSKSGWPCFDSNPARASNSLKRALPKGKNSWSRVMWKCCFRSKVTIWLARITAVLFINLLMFQHFMYFTIRPRIDFRRPFVRSTLVWGRSACSSPEQQLVIEPPHDPCLSACLSFCLSFCLSVSLPVCLPASLPACWVPACLLVCLSI